MAEEGIDLEEESHTPGSDSFWTESWSSLADLLDATRRFVVQMDSVERTAEPVPGLKTSHAWGLSGWG